MDGVGTKEMNELVSKQTVNEVSCPSTWDLWPSDLYQVAEPAPPPVTDAEHVKIPDAKGDDA